MVLRLDLALAVKRKILREEYLPIFSFLKVLSRAERRLEL